MSWIKSNQGNGGVAVSDVTPSYYPFKYYPHGVGLQISPIFDTWMDFSRNATEGQWLVTPIQQASIRTVSGEINDAGICENPRAIANLQEMYAAHPGPFATNQFVGGVVGDYVGKTCDNPAGMAAAISFDYYYQFYMIKPLGDEDFYFQPVTSKGWAANFQSLQPSGGGYQLRRKKLWMSYGGTRDNVNLNGLDFPWRTEADHIRDPDASPYNLLASSDYIELYPSLEIYGSDFSFGENIGNLAFTAKCHLFNKSADIGYQVNYDHRDGLKMGFFQNMPELYLQQIYPELALVVYGAPKDAYVFNKPAWPNFK